MFVTYSLIFFGFRFSFCWCEWALAGQLIGRAQEALLSKKLVMFSLHSIVQANHSPDWTIQITLAKKIFVFPTFFPTFLPELKTVDKLICFWCGMIHLYFYQSPLSLQRFHFATCCGTGSSVIVVKLCPMGNQATFFQIQFCLATHPFKCAIFNRDLICTNNEHSEWGGGISGYHIWIWSSICCLSHF